MTITLDLKDLAWASGFWDGEGCTSLQITKRKTGYVHANMCLAISNTNLQALERFQRAVNGLGVIRPVDHSKQYRKDHWKQCYYWTVQSFETVQSVMCMLWPMLEDEKRTQYEIKYREYRECNKNSKSKGQIRLDSMAKLQATIDRLTSELAN